LCLLTNKSTKKERKRRLDDQIRIMKKTQTKWPNNSNDATALLLLLLLLPTVNSWVCYLPRNWLLLFSQGKVMQIKELVWNFKHYFTTRFYLVLYPFLLSWWYLGGRFLAQII
jgi:hypothetical protein